MALPLRRAAQAIQPAKLIAQKGHLIPGQFYVQELFFEVPKNYAKPDAGTLTLFGRTVNKYEKPIVGPSLLDGATSDKPYFVYLEGGPGFGNREPQELPLTRWLLNRGYQVLYLDYRGTGMSTPVNADHIVTLGDAQAQADYLKLFRADNIVRDLEAVRQCLTADFPEDKKKWSSFGQSFGGFVTLTYLSYFPNGLRECFMTGGLAPIRRTAEDVYRATFKKVVQRNQAYYEKYPEDVERVHRVANHIIEKGGIALPAGGKLTVPRLLSMGIAFGAHGGLDSVHSIILRADTDLEQFGFLTRASLQSLEGQNSLDVSPIYAILHEPIYCFKKGIASSWAAFSVGKQLDNFSWLAGEPKSTRGDNNKTPLYFSGEMIFPFHFDTYPDLVKIKDAANILAAYDQWEPLYDEDQLRANEVPLYAAGYIDDMYVDVTFARETASIVRGTKVFETNSMYHNAVRARSEEVLGQLFRMRDDTID